jgi:hypothetical protein
MSLAAGLLVCYNSTTLIGMVLGFLLIGLGISLQFLISGFLLMTMMPEHLALGAGISSAGHALSPMFWGILGKEILNPGDLKPDIIVQEGEMEIRYFSAGVAGRCDL